MDCEEVFRSSAKPLCRMEALNTLYVEGQNAWSIIPRTATNKFLELQVYPRQNRVIACYKYGDEKIVLLSTKEDVPSIKARLGVCQWAASERLFFRLFVAVYGCHWSVNAKRDEL